MKVYRCDVSEGRQLSWHSSKREAEIYWSQARRGRGLPFDGPPGVHLVALPESKTAMLAWLNANVYRSSECY